MICDLSSCNKIRKIIRYPFQLETSLNPNWDIHDDARTLFYVKANGDNDTLHYIWNLNRQPSVLVALTQLNANVTFKWNQQTKDTEQLTFSEKPKYTMSFVLTKVSNWRTQFRPYFRLFRVYASD